MPIGADCRVTYRRSKQSSPAHTSLNDSFVAAFHPQGRRERERLLTMTFPILFNPLFQMTAAFVIFFAGFITLFSFIALCVVIGWALYRCTTRLALLISRSHEETAPLVSNVASSNTVAGIRGQPVQSPPLPG